MFLVMCTAECLDLAGVRGCYGARVRAQGYMRFETTADSLEMDVNFQLC